jgi:hypothetical protein
MKKSKIFMATGAFVLAISAIFATKANKRFAQVQTAVASDFVFVAPSAAIMTTVQGTGQRRIYVQLCSANGTSLGVTPSNPLYTKTTDHAIYFK